MSSNDQPSGQGNQNASNLSNEIASRIRDTVIGNAKSNVDKAAATPKSTRFKKGVSGNPMGRPRTRAGAAGKQNNGSIEVSEHAYQLAIDRIILEFANKELTVKVGDQVVKMSGREALAQAQAKAALNGNAHAQKDIQNRIERAERAQLRQRAEDAMFWRDYKRVMKAELDRRAEEGTEIDEEALLPHPDDVEINNDLTIRFTGPTTPKALSKCKETMRYRTALILQAELDVRLADDDADMPGQGALVMARVLESSLPVRMRFSEADWFNAVWKTQTINKRTLLKQVRQAWQDAFTDRGGRLDTNVRRGLQFPGTHAVQNLVTDLQDFCHEASKKDWHISHDDAAEFCDIANEFGKSIRQKNG